MKLVRIEWKRVVFQDYGTNRLLEMIAMRGGDTAISHPFDNLSEKLGMGSPGFCNICAMMRKHVKCTLCRSTMGSRIYGSFNIYKDIQEFRNDLEKR